MLLRCWMNECDNAEVCPLSNIGDSEFMVHFALGDDGEFHFETFGEGFLEYLYKHYPALSSLENRDDPAALARAVAQERESVRRKEAPEPETELGKELKQQTGMPTSLVDKYIRKMAAVKLKKFKPKGRPN